MSLFQTRRNLNKPDTKLRPGFTSWTLNTRNNVHCDPLSFGVTLMQDGRLAQNLATVAVGRLLLRVISRKIKTKASVDGPSPRVSQLPRSQDEDRNRQVSTRRLLTIYQINPHHSPSL
ncbi:hypothetical protein CBL_02851 [Carabus blaptoides fortunei]